MADIRNARSADLPSVLSLYGAWLAEEPAGGMTGPEPGYFETRLGPYLCVAEEEGELVGFASGTIHTSERLTVIPSGERYLELEELYVRPDHRHHGIGTRLVSTLVAEAAAAGVSGSLVYSSMKDWRRLVDFYERMGFEMWFVRLFRRLP